MSKVSGFGFRVSGSDRHRLRHRRRRRHRQVQHFNVSTRLFIFLHHAYQRSPLFLTPSPLGEGWGEVGSTRRGRGFQQFHASTIPQLAQLTIEAIRVNACYSTISDRFKPCIPEHTAHLPELPAYVPEYSG